MTERHKYRRNDRKTQIQTERQKDRKTDKHTDRQKTADRQKTGRKTEGQKDRKINRKTLLFFSGVCVRPSHHGWNSYLHNFEESNYETLCGALGEIYRSVLLFERKIHKLLFPNMYF